MDEIKRKLELIDQQLTGSSYHRQIISTAPLVFVAAGLIVGIVAQNAFNLPVIAWLGLLTIFAAAAVVSFLNWKSEIGNWKFAYLAFACFFCLGGVRLTGYYQPASNDVRNLIGDERKLATIRGEILTEPRVNKNEQWVFAKFTHNDPSSSFYLKLNEAETTTGWAKVTGIIRVQVDEPVLDLKTGDYVLIFCWLDKFKGPHNPGQFDIAEYMKRNNVFVAASVKSRDSIELLKENSSGIFTTVQGKLKKIANEAMLGDSPVQEQSQALLAALLLGYRTDIDAATNEAFRQTGLFHFISLSGMNFAILVGIIWWLCKATGLMKPARAAVSMVAAVIFLLVVPPNAPAMRAGVMCTVFCASFFFRRQSNPLNSLSMAAIILLLIKPTELFEVSWQLSFAAVLGIILFTDRIANFLSEKIAGLLPVLKFGRFLSEAMAISFAACLTSSGILLYHFYTINYLTWLWTILVSPLITIISVIGYLKIIIALVLPTIANFLGIIANVLSDWLIRIVKLFAGWHISEVLIGSVPLIVIILYYGFIFFAAYVRINRPLLKKAIVTVMFSAIILFLGVSKCQRVYRDNLIVTA
ncbi:MAG: ComEC/Rec2 family competence protein, partial [Planctomycetota bacterium]|nr:ComEC/Rec2 family competence protein [Planctomycetota bacterium]